MKYKITMLVLFINITILYSQPASNRTTSASEKNSDMHFVTEASKGGMKEVEMGTMGQSKATNARVKNYASMMVRDHTKANEELKGLVANKKLTVPSKDEHNMHMNLENKKGADFDKEYMRMMVEDHNKDIALFEKESKSGNDAELKAFAAKTLPTLQMHLDSAKAVYSAIK
jgi:putative membrane protein